MIKNSSHQKGSAHVVIIVILVVALLGALGFVFWQNFMNKDSKEESVKQTTTQTDSPKKVTYVTYQTDTHPISFSYPSTWKLENAQGSDEYLFSRTVDVKTDDGNVVTFMVGAQGLGGTCGGRLPTYSITDVVSTSLKGAKPIVLSYMVVTNNDGTYEARYGLTDTYTTIGEGEICTLPYIFDPSIETYHLMGFSGTKKFTSFDDAKKFVSSDEYNAIKKMMLTLKY